VDKKGIGECAYVRHDTIRTERHSPAGSACVSFSGWWVLDAGGMDASQVEKSEVYFIYTRSSIWSARVVPNISRNLT